MSKKITDLTSATTPLAGTELVEIVQGGVSKKVAASYLSSSGGIREILSANRTYYVRTDGSNSNDGLSNTSGGAFLTVQKAVDVVYQTLDLGIYNVTIQVGDGTYSGNVLCNGPLIGSGTLTISGNSGAPTNVIFSTGSSVSVISQNGAAVNLEYFKVTNTATYGIQATKKGHINFNGLDFGSVTSQQIRSDDYGSVTATGNYTISAGAGWHLVSVAGMIRIQSRTITISGTPAYSVAFAECNMSGGTMLVNGNTYSGSATGPRYTVYLNGVIQTGGGGATYFPGNSAHATPTATGGQYA